MADPVLGSAGRDAARIAAMTRPSPAMAGMLAGAERHAARMEALTRPSPAMAGMVEAAKARVAQAEAMARPSPAIAGMLASAERHAARMEALTRPSPVAGLSRVDVLRGIEGWQAQRASTLLGSRSGRIASDLAFSIATGGPDIAGLRYRASAVAQSIAFVPMTDLRGLVDSARRVEPNAGATDGAFAVVTSRAAVNLPVPVDAVGSPTSDPVALSEWMHDLTLWALAASGLDERDLAEDAAAAYIYILVASIAMSLFLQFPVTATILAMLGFAAHQPALAASRVSRRLYCSLDRTSDQADEESADE